ncbi:electron transport complex protein [Candidatus Photodesmus katoptron]|uniref:Ion-translocating oxidoreductase complex subunit E n=1 Tax=Candidatus Photodesmus katoptron Akat1 TaxID=1236703 RepID=S3DIW6_9GAMM|nr:electron transport complex subunit E [Candidatus Photodesmus katoptron]EPE37655.1 electron transport complex, RnfABCDGE type, E subunit [Candidatus Photodesmus katoptron Akat1]KEY90625.1 electron transport complex protein [Candidatus Photodesmus katoptron]
MVYHETNPIKNGIWNNNPALVQLLGLCPLLAISTTVTNSLGLGIATLFVLIFSSMIISSMRKYILKEIRIPIFVMVISSLVSCVQLLINAYAHELYTSLGIFIPLIVTNCIIIGRAEAFASKNRIILSLKDAFGIGIGMTISLSLLGAIREILGKGTIFSDANLLLGKWASIICIRLFDFDTNFLLVLLPPGAFISLGFLIACKNILDKNIQKNRN